LSGAAADNPVVSDDPVVADDPVDPVVADVADVAETGAAAAMTRAAAARTDPKMFMADRAFFIELTSRDPVVSFELCGRRTISR
jgi:hypothetical protein